MHSDKYPYPDDQPGNDFPDAFDVPGAVLNGDTPAEQDTVEFERHTPSVADRYYEILGTSTRTMMRTWAEIRTRQERLAPGLERLYRTRPYLKPESMLRTQEADIAFIGYLAMEPSHGLLPEDVALYYSDKSEDSLAHGEGWYELPAALAAASVRSDDDPAVYKKYRRLLMRKGVSEVVSTHLGRHAGLFVTHDLEDVPLSDIMRAGLDVGDLRAQVAVARQIPGSVPDVAINPHDGPPLYLSQLAADVRNFNHDSVLPVGVNGVVRQAQGYARLHKPQAGFAANVRSWRDELMRAQASYLKERYGYRKTPSGRILSILTEADLSERQGFEKWSDDLQLRTAKRTERIFGRAKASDGLPESVELIVARCVELVRAKPTEPESEDDIHQERRYRYDSV